MAKLLAYPEPMDVVQFLAFYETRPEGEKWELLDGKLVMNATPVNRHQAIVANLIGELEFRLRKGGRRFRATAGIGTRLSGRSLVEPDVMIRERAILDGNVCDDVIVAFEVLSLSTRRNDLVWKRRNYTALATLTHYVVVSADKPEVRVYARAMDWQEQKLNRLTEEIIFTNLGLKLSIAEIYDDVLSFRALN